MAGKVLPRTVFELLVKHLVDIEERKEQLLDRYYPDITEERRAFKELIENYISKVEDCISNAEVREEAISLCPFVIIGSIVELENLDCSEFEKYHIVSPYETKQDYDIDFASILSPMGRALLLKEVRDKVTIENPMGEFSYRIKSIEIPNEISTVVNKDG